MAYEVLDPNAWVVDDTGIAKDDDASACVARQYSGTLGKIGTHQVAVSVRAVTEAASGSVYPRPAYVDAVKGATTAYPHDAQPETAPQNPTRTCHLDRHLPALPRNLPERTKSH